ncbi:ATP-binding protein [Singulisphaera sp. PoT]|uniref:PAS domain-containing sensor histidine kinase n=1 Tax=Singulisphaera sp. PoT TaxID=3411797 RepID=UPI003BF5A73F
MHEREGEVEALARDLFEQGAGDSRGSSDLHRVGTGETPGACAEDARPGLVGELWAINEELSSRLDTLQVSNDLTAWLRNSGESSFEGAIIATTSDGIITDWNAQAEQIFGFAHEEAPGNSIAMIQGPARLFERTGSLREAARGACINYNKTVRIRRNGKIVDVSLSLLPIRNSLSRVVGVSMVARGVDGRKRLDGKILEAADPERARIGQDLHDDIGQELTALALIAESPARQCEGSSPATVELVSKLTGAIERSHKKLREFPRGFVPAGVGPEGLMAALGDLAMRITNQARVPCTFACEGTVLVEHGVAATQLYRIVQEAVTNALKHGRARHIRIGLEGGDGLVTLRIQDDGIGFGAEASTPREAGIGLEIMRRRARLIDATLDIGPAVGGGTLVVCTQLKGLSR